MAISDTQKVDYLFKKLGFGTTKTDTNDNKLAANESIASPLLLRGDKVWQQAGDIPNVKPSSSSSIVEVYTGASTVECTQDITATGNRTWKTNLTDWITTEFGSTYLVNVYIHTSGDAGNAEDISNKVFITGSGNNDEWFFDYQSGVLNFIGDNLPNGVDFSGKSVYITGARYIGGFGVGAAAGEDANLGNLVVSGNTISSVNINDNIVLDPNGTGQLVIQGNNAITIPSGTTAQRPSGSTGDIRVNSDTGKIEFYDGTAWQVVSPSVDISTIDTFDSDGSTVAFTLSESTTSSSTIVTLNGVVQSPGNAYNISGTTLTFTEAPHTGDKIEVRYISTVFTPGSIISDSDTSVQVDDDNANIVSKINNSNVVVTTASTTTMSTDLVVTGAIKSDTFYFVKRSTNTAITYPGSYGAVTIDYEDAGDDYGSTDAMWNSSTDRFTPTVAGLWYFRASIDCYPGTTAEGGIQILKNGSIVAQVSHIGAIRPQATTHLYMNGTTDYVQFKAYTQGSTTRNQQPENSFFEALLIKQSQ